MKRQMVLLLFTTGAVVTISFFTARHVRSQQILHAAKRPFTIDIYERSVTVDSGRTLETHSFTAKRSDGSVVEGSYIRLPDGRLTQTRLVTLADQQKRVLVHDLTGSVSTQLLPESAIITLKASPKDPTCRSNPDRAGPSRVIGEGEMLGFKVVKVLEEDPISGSTFERWLAPDLDCTPLSSKAALKAPQDRTRVRAVAEKTAISVALGEPRSDLFAIPAQFQEVPPSVVVEKAAREENLPAVGDELREKLDRLDRVYHEAQRAH
jgi:hypothetical protein